MSELKERDIERHLVNRVKELGGEVRKVQWIGRRGAPDRLVMLPVRRLTDTLDCAWCNPGGAAIWVELKSPGKKPEPHQLREHNRMRAMGQRVEVIDSIEGIEELLK
jgi:hypothetical protein